MDQCFLTLVCAYICILYTCLHTFIWADICIYRFVYTYINIPTHIGQSIVTRLPSNDSLSSGNREQLRPKTLVVENYRHESGFGKR
jgi:hypothetical protein